MGMMENMCYGSIGPQVKEAAERVTGNYALCGNGEVTPSTKFIRVLMTGDGADLSGDDECFKFLDEVLKDGLAASSYEMVMWSFLDDMRNSKRYSDEMLDKYTDSSLDHIAVVSRAFRRFSRILYQALRNAPKDGDDLLVWLAGLCVAIEQHCIGPEMSSNRARAIKYNKTHDYSGDNSTEE